MSNKTQLQTNNTALDGLITRVNAAKDVAASLPEAGGSGGDLATCNITLNYITTENMGIEMLCYSKLGNQGIENVVLAISEYHNYTTILENVLCNTMILVYLEEASPDMEVSSNIIALRHEHWLSAVGVREFIVTGGSTGTITINNSF